MAPGRDASTRRRAIDEAAAAHLARLEALVRARSAAGPVTVVICDVDGTIDADRLGGDGAVMALLEAQWARFHEVVDGLDVGAVVVGGRLFVVVPGADVAELEARLAAALGETVAWEGVELFAAAVVWHEHIPASDRADGALKRVTERLGYNRGQSTRSLMRALGKADSLSSLLQVLVTPVERSWDALEILDESGGVLVRSERMLARSPDVEMDLGTARRLRFRVWEPVDVWDRGEFEHLLRETAPVITNAIDRVVALDEVRDAAERDPLTGSLNRAGLARRLPQIDLEREAGTMAVVDLDHLKVINDTLGHAAGDRAIEQVAALLGAAFVDGLVGRWGGEEFVVVASIDLREAEARLDRVLREALAIDLREGRPLSFSAGVTGWAPGERFEDVFDRADRALYGAKGAGRGRVAAGPDDRGEEEARSTAN